MLFALTVGILMSVGGSQLAAGASEPPSPLRESPIPLQTQPEATPAAWESAGCRAAEEGRMELARRSWRTAYELDPSRWSPAFRLALSYGLSDPKETLHWLLEALQAGWSSFRNQYYVILNAFLLVIGAFLVTSLLLGLIWALRELPLVYHGLLEMLKKSLPNSVAIVGAAGILCLPLLADLGFLVTLAVPVTLGALLSKGVPRRGVILVGLLVILSPLGLVLLGQLAQPVDPVHPVALVERAQRGAGDHHLRLVLDKEIEKQPREPLLRFARSWCAWQADEKDLASEDLIFLEARGGIDRSKVLVNRAALDISVGNSEAAIERLLKARRFSSARATISYNLALAYADLVILERAKEEFKRAQEQDPNRILEAGRLRTRFGFPQPLRDRLSNAELWVGALGSQRTLKGLPLPQPLALLFPAGNPWLLWPAGALVGLLLAAFLPRVRALHIRTCSRCGRSICRRCVVRVGLRGHCRACAATVRSRGKGWNEVIIFREELPLGAGSPWRLGGLFLMALGVLLPGFPQVLQGQNVKGFLYIFGASALWLLLAYGGPPVPGLGGSETGVHGGPIWLLLPAAFLLLLGICSGRSATLHHRRRESLAVWIGVDLRKAA